MLPEGFDLRVCWCVLILLLHRAAYKKPQPNICDVPCCSCTAPADARAEGDPFSLCARLYQAVAVALRSVATLTDVLLAAGR